MNNYRTPSFRYVNGKMSLQERADFEKTLAGDPELSEEIEFLQLIQAGLEAEERDQVRELMHSWDEDEVAEPAATVRKFVSKKWIYSGIAATLIILLLVAFFRSGPGLESRQEYVTAHYSPPPNENLSPYIAQGHRGGIEGVQAFVDGNYATALRSFERFTGPPPFGSEPYLVKTPHLDMIHLLAGRCHLMLPSDTAGAYATAHFNRVLEFEETSLKGESRWYLHFSLVLEGKIEQGIEQLEYIKDEADHPRRGEASALLDGFPF